MAKEVSEATAYEAMRLAQVHEHEGGMVSSAKLCVKDAEKLFNEGRYEHAYGWAVRSLKYSVGVFHADYAKAVAL